MNFGTLQRDEATGLDFIIDRETKERSYKHPNCGLCGTARFSRQTVLPDCDETCPLHPRRRVAEMFG